MNPLKKMFRQPVLYIPLPSGGIYYDSNTLEKTSNGEYPIFPMTASDEIVLKSADALMNGQAMRQLIESCVPNIKNALNLVSIDIDALLISIRIASSGNIMMIDTNCPKCAKEARYDVHLSSIYDKLTSLNLRSRYIEPLTILKNGAVIRVFFKPMLFSDMVEAQLENYHEIKTAQALQDTSIPEEQRFQIISEAVNKMSKSLIHKMTRSIASISIEEGGDITETDHAGYIEEFLNNTDTETFNKFSDHMQKINSGRDYANARLTCIDPECGEIFNRDITFNPTVFF